MGGSESKETLSVRRSSPTTFLSMAKFKKTLGMDGGQRPSTKDPHDKSSHILYKRGNPPSPSVNGTTIFIANPKNSPDKDPGTGRNRRKKQLHRLGNRHGETGTSTPSLVKVIDEKHVDDNNRRQGANYHRDSAAVSPVVPRKRVPVAGLATNSRLWKPGSSLITSMANLTAGNQASRGRSPLLPRQHWLRPVGPLQQPSPPPSPPPPPPRTSAPPCELPVRVCKAVSATYAASSSSFVGSDATLPSSYCRNKQQLQEPSKNVRVFNPPRTVDNENIGLLRRFCEEIRCHYESQGEEDHHRRLSAILQLDRQLEERAARAMGRVKVENRNESIQENSSYPRNNSKDLHKTYATRDVRPDDYRQKERQCDGEDNDKSYESHNSRRNKSPSATIRSAQNSSKDHGPRDLLLNMCHLRNYNRQRESITTSSRQQEMEEESRTPQSDNPTPKELKSNSIGDLSFKQSFNKINHPMPKRPRSDSTVDLSTEDSYHKLKHKPSDRSECSQKQSVSPTKKEGDLEYTSSQNFKDKIAGNSWLGDSVIRSFSSKNENPDNITQLKRFSEKEDVLKEKNPGSDTQSGKGGSCESFSKNKLSDHCIPYGTRSNNTDDNPKGNNAESDKRSVKSGSASSSSKHECPNDNKRGGVKLGDSRSRSSTEEARGRSDTMRLLLDCFPNDDARRDGERLARSLPRSENKLDVSIGHAEVQTCPVLVSRKLPQPQPHGPCAPPSNNTDHRGNPVRYLPVCREDKSSLSAAGDKSRSRDVSDASPVSRSSPPAHHEDEESGSDQSEGTPTAEPSLTKSSQASRRDFPHSYQRRTSEMNQCYNMPVYYTDAGKDLVKKSANKARNSSGSSAGYVAVKDGVVTRDTGVRLRGGCHSEPYVEKLDICPDSADTEGSSSARVVHSDKETSNEFLNKVKTSYPCYDGRTNGSRQGYDVVCHNSSYSRAHTEKPDCKGVSRNESTYFPRNFPKIRGTFSTSKSNNLDPRKTCHHKFRDDCSLGDYKDNCCNTSAVSSARNAATVFDPVKKLSIYSGDRDGKSLIGKRHVSPQNYFSLSNNVDTVSETRGINISKHEQSQAPSPQFHSSSCHSTHGCCVSQQDYKGCQRGVHCNQCGRFNPDPYSSKCHCSSSDDNLSIYPDEEIFSDTRYSNLRNVSATEKATALSPKFLNVHCGQYVAGCDHRHPIRMKQTVDKESSCLYDCRGNKNALTPTDVSCPANIQSRCSYNCRGNNSPITPSDVSCSANIHILRKDLSRKLPNYQYRCFDCGPFIRKEIVPGRVLYEHSATLPITKISIMTDKCTKQLTPVRHQEGTPCVCGSSRRVCYDIQEDEEEDCKSEGSTGGRSSPFQKARSYFQRPCGPSNSQH